MKTLKIIMEDALVKDLINGKSDTFLVETWPMSYKRFVETDTEGNVVHDSDNMAVPKQFDKLSILSTDGRCYEAKVDNIEVSDIRIPSEDKDGKVILDEDGKTVMQPAVLLYKDKEWAQNMIAYTISDIKKVSAFDAPIKKNSPSMIKDNWLHYKEGARGKQVIDAFEKASAPDVTIEEQINLIKQYASNYIENAVENDFKRLGDILDDFYTGLGDFTLSELPTNIQEATDFYEGYIGLLQDSYKVGVGLNLHITLNLYALCPKFFFPNLFVMNFIALQRFFDKYNLTLPEMPSKTNWAARSSYYSKLNEIVYQFRIDNDLSPAELCALMFDYAQRQVEQSETILPEPSQAWLIGGTSGDGEKDADYRFWQANPDTKRGDILIHYEKYPTKAITAVWRAEENGIVDPFFWYYSNTYAGHKIDVPLITLDELKKDEFFKNPESPVGKLINKNFQGVNGWTVSGDDYKHFLDIWKTKGCDIEKLPKLYAPELPNGVTIVHESDVSNQLLRPMLNAMGWKENENYKPEVHFKAGRGSAKRPDFCLHIKGEGEDIEAKVIFECKLYMKNSKEIEANFTQGRSYAKWGNAQVLVLCDKEQLLVYERHHGSFDRNKFKKFYWGEVMGGDSDKFNELKKLLS